MTTRKDEAMPVASEPPISEPTPELKLPEVPIVVLTRNERVCLVQWFAGKRERRCYLPANAVQGSQLPCNVLEQGVPYGVPWRDVLRPAVTVERLEQALHAAGLWTFEDVQMFPDRALSALQSAYGIDLGQLLVAATEFNNHTKEG